MDLDARYLQTFLEVARARSFSRAAATLHKSQPAVSYQIAQLEEQLGTRLIDRTSRRLALTSAGARLHDLCAAFFADFARFAAGLRDPEAAWRDPLRIAAVSGFGRYVLFPLLARLPALRGFSLRYPTADQVFAAVLDGACDVGFVYLPLVSSRLATTAVFREELVLIAPARAPWRQVPRTLDAFSALPCVTYDESEYVFGKWFETSFGRQPRSLGSDFHFEELEEVVATVAAGHGWSIVPDHCARPASARGGARILRRPRRAVHNLVYAVTRAGAPSHPGIAGIVAQLARL